MAQILFKYKNNTDNALIKKAYPVSIKPDGWYKGNPNWYQSAYADTNKWLVIDVLTASVEELAYLCKNQSITEEKSQSYYFINIEYTPNGFIQKTKSQLLAEIQNEANN